MMEYSALLMAPFEQSDIKCVTELIGAKGPLAGGCVCVCVCMRASLCVCVFVYVYVCV